MFKRKLLTALYTAILLTIVAGIFAAMVIPFSLKEGYTFSELTINFGALPFIFFYALIGNLVYGLPVSIISEYITKRIEEKKQFLFSFIIHIVFGFITIFILGWLAIYAVVSSIIFSLVDMRLKNNHNRLFRKITFIK